MSAFERTLIQRHIVSLRYSCRSAVGNSSAAVRGSAADVILQVRRRATASSALARLAGEPPHCHLHACSDAHHSSPPNSDSSSESESSSSAAGGDAVERRPASRATDDARTTAAARRLPEQSGGVGGSGCRCCVEPGCLSSLCFAAEPSLGSVQFGRRKTSPLTISCL